MLRPFLFASLLLASFTTFAQDRSSGCGMGWQVTRSMTTTGSYTRALTNATFSNTIAMTLGTSGCAKHDLVMLEKQKIHYVENNLVPLKREMATGKGERIQALAQVWGCPNSDALTGLLRANYAEVYRTEDPNAVVERVNQIIRRNPHLETACEIKA